MADKIYLKNRPKSESPAVRKAFKEALGDKKRLNPILALFTKKGRKAWKAELKHAATPTLEAEEIKQYGSSQSLASAKLKKKKSTNNQRSIWMGQSKKTTGTNRSKNMEGITSSLESTKRNIYVCT